MRCYFRTKIISFYLLIPFVALSNLYGNWIVLNQPPHHYTRAFSFISPDVGFIGQSCESHHYCDVWKTTDGCITYQNIAPLQDTSLEYIIRGVRFFDAINGFLWRRVRNPIPGPDTFWCELLKTTDRGQTWDSIYKALIRNFSFFPLNINCGYLVGGFISKTTDGGLTWSSVSIPGNSANGVYFLDTLTGYAINGCNFWKTADGGANWQLIAAFPDTIISLADLQFTDYLNGYLSAAKTVYLHHGDDEYDKGIILKTTNGGYSWEEIFSGSRDSEIDEMFFISNDTGYISYLRSGDEYDYAKLFKTTNGRDFSSLHLPKRGLEDIGPIYFIKGTQTGYIRYANEDGNYLLKTVDGGGESLGFWQLLTTIPEKPKNCMLLSYVPETYSLFLLAQGRTPKLWRYDIGADSWQTKNPVPVKFKDGSMTYDGEGLSAIRYRTNECRHYDIENDNWFQYSTIPGETLVKKGGCITSDWDSLLFVLKGGKKNEFWMYNKENDNWVRKPDIPGIFVTKGASIACDGEYVYAFKGGKTNEFWAYSIEGDSWKRMPDIAGYGIKDGSCISANPFSDDKKFLFALKGSTQECWYYDVGSSYWKLAPGIPGKKKIKKGAQVTIGEDNVVYAIKAKKRQEIWYTDELTGSTINSFSQKAVSQNIQSNNDKKLASKFNIRWVNPTNKIILNFPEENWVSFSVYDITGRQIKKFSKFASRNTDFELNLLPGIYFVRLKTSTETITKKIVIAK